MVTLLVRILKYGFQSFWRNKWLSTTTVAVMMLALFMFESLFIFSVITDNFLSTLKDKIDISVYFKNQTEEDQILKIKRSIEAMNEVKGVQYISRDDALKLFQERHKDEAETMEALAVVGSNPLLASLNIVAKDPKEYPASASFLNNDNLTQYVDRVDFTQRELVIRRLVSILDIAQRGGVTLIIILSIIAILVTLNTIMLSIHSTRDEISVMRLVGASNKFIRGPYVIQGVLYGILAAILSLILFSPVVHFTSPYLKVLMPGMDLQIYFYSNLIKITFYQVFFGMVIGAISSGIAVARYLKI